MFLVAAIMQGILLVMCLGWKVRQRRLNIDDFGHPLRNRPLPELPNPHELNDEESIEETFEDATEDDLVSISHEEAEGAPLLRDRRRKTRRRKWWAKWLGMTR
jgi:hypothetical protein